jgi:hypothetical protein
MNNCGEPIEEQIPRREAKGASLARDDKQKQRWRAEARRYESPFQTSSSRAAFRLVK